MSFDHRIPIDREDFEILVGGGIRDAPRGTRVAIRVRIDGKEVAFYLTDTELLQLMESLNELQENAISFYLSSLGRDAQGERLPMSDEGHEDIVSRVRERFDVS